MNRSVDAGKDTYRTLFDQGVPSKQTYSFKKAEVNWPKALDAANDLTQTNELYSLMIEETTRFFREISAKDYIFDVRWMMPLSDQFAEKMRSFSVNEPPNFMLDLEKSLSLEYKEAKNADRLLQQFFNYALFYNLVLIYVKTPSQILEVCDDMVDLVSNMRDLGKTNKIVWTEKNADSEVEFYSALKEKLINKTSSLSDEELNRITEFWKKNDNKNISKHLLNAKGEHNKSKSPFGGSKRIAKRDEEIEIFVSNLISTKDQ